MNNTQTPVPWENIRYGSALVNIPAKGNDVYVISDLHLAAGLNANGNYEGTENFFADDSFVRFLDHLQHKSISNRATLIINGDFIDFLRITNIPVTEADFVAWQSILSITGVVNQLMS